MDKSRLFSEVSVEETGRFLDTAIRVTDAERNGESIGTYMEKTIHAVLKHFYAPGPDALEREAAGYIADVCFDGNIIEIQSKQFGRLRRKLEAYLPEYDVTVVYPVACVKYLRTVDPETGAVSAARKSPKKGSPYDLFDELYSIKQYLKSPRLHIEVVGMETEEYRMKLSKPARHGRMTSPGDRIPLRLMGKCRLDGPMDYMMFLPEELPEEFTVKDFALEAKLDGRQAGIALNILAYLGVIEKTGKRGNAFLYKVTY